MRGRLAGIHQLELIREGQSFPQTGDEHAWIRSSTDGLVAAMWGAISARTAERA
jgi:hypothetical protein